MNEEKGYWNFFLLFIGIPLWFVFGLVGWTAGLSNLYMWIYGIVGLLILMIFASPLQNKEQSKPARSLK